VKIDFSLENNLWELGLVLISYAIVQWLGMTGVIFLSGVYFFLSAVFIGLGRKAKEKLP